MNCQDFENRFHDLLDERKHPGNDPALRSHAESCSECRDLLAAEGQMFAGLQASRLPPPGRDFADKVVAELSRPQPRSSFRLDGRWLAVALTAVAAMTLLMFSPAWTRRPNSGGSKPPVVTTQPHKMNPSAAPDSADGWDDYKLVWDQLSVSLPQWEYEEMTPSGTWALVAYAIDFFRRTFPEDHPRPTPQDNQPRGAMFPLSNGVVWS